MRWSPSASLLLALSAFGPSWLCALRASRSSPTRRRARSLRKAASSGFASRLAARPPGPHGPLRSVRRAAPRREHISSPPADTHSRPTTPTHDLGSGRGLHSAAAVQECNPPPEPGETTMCPADPVKPGSSRSLRCEMQRDCDAPVTHIDVKGYVYCTHHGIHRRAHQFCRKLRPCELRRLQRGLPLRRY